MTIQVGRINDLIFMIYVIIFMLNQLSVEEVRQIQWKWWVNAFESTHAMASKNGEIKYLMEALATKSGREPDFKWNKYRVQLI